MRPVAHAEFHLHLEMCLAETAERPLAAKRKYQPNSAERLRSLRLRMPEAGLKYSNLRSFPDGNPKRWAHSAWSLSTLIATRAQGRRARFLDLSSPFKEETFQNARPT